MPTTDADSCQVVASSVGLWKCEPKNVSGIFIVLSSPRFRLHLVIFVSCVDIGNSFDLFCH